MVYGGYSASRGLTVADYPNQNVYVSWNNVYHNVGNPDINNKHTGNGVVVSQTATSIIERNVAHYNGELNDNPNGGPVGIWYWDSLNCVIQYNESHHNKSLTQDGGGIDLDGGVRNCAIQYNYTHHNFGGGYLIAQFDNAPTMKNVSVRFNISENDARRGMGTGSISIWNGDTGGPAITGLKIYNNTIFTDGSVDNPFNRTMTAISIFGSAPVSGSGATNNIFFVKNALLLSQSNLNAEFGFHGNSYYNASGTFHIGYKGTAYSTLSAWQNATGQETFGGVPTGTSVNPQLTAPGSAGTLNNAALLNTIIGYKLLPESPLINAGFDLGWYGMSMGAHDFFDQPLPSAEGGEAYDIGAHEY